MSFDCSTVDVEHMLDTLEIRNVSIGTTEATYSCPFPRHVNGDETPSAQMNLETTQFRCYGCKERGNAISFVSGVLAISPLESIRMLRQAYDPGAYDPDQVSMVAELERLQAGSVAPVERPQPVLDESMLDRYAVDWEAVVDARENGQAVAPVLTYMLDRGFSADVLEDWEFGFDPLTGRITFAVRDEHGQLVGFKARATDGREPKYLVLGDKPGRNPYHGFPHYFPSRICFGAHRLRPDSDIVICEGELNAIAISARSGRNSVAINGSFFSDRHARIIRNSGGSVTLFLDDDKAGKDATFGWTDSKGNFHPGIVQRLQDHMPVFLAPASDQDAAELTGPEIESLLDRADSALVRQLSA